MKNKLFIIILTLSLVLTPFASFAQGTDVLAETSAVVSSLEASLYEVDEIAGEPKVAYEYHREEQEIPADLPQIGCKAAYVADPVSGKVFYEKKAHKKMYPASTTKLLTALLVLEQCNLDDTAVVSQRAVSLVPDGYVRANLQPGEELSVLDLLKALLIPSANDAAYVLAEHVAGSIEAFAAQCNQRAKELGCETLHFVNPNGIHSKNHYCSAYDLYLIANACRQYKTFNKIVLLKNFTLPATNAYGKTDRKFNNTNLLLDPKSPYYYYGCTGIKTGHTDAAGECLVSGCSNENLNMVSVVLGGKIRGNENDRFSDTVKLFDFVNDHYDFRRIADKTVPLSHVTVKKATKNTAELDVVIQSDIESVTPAGLTDDRILVQIHLPEELKAPIQQNQVLGSVSYEVDGLNYATNLVAQHAVEKKPYWIYNLLVVLAVILVICILQLIGKKRRENRRKQELLRRRRMQQMQQRRQAQARNQNQQDNRFHR